MSGPLSKPARVALVAWSGDAAQRAARLRVNEDTLTARLRALAFEGSGKRLVVEVALSNCGPIMDALARMLKGGAP